MMKLAPLHWSWFYGGQGSWLEARTHSLWVLVPTRMPTSCDIWSPVSLSPKVAVELKECCYAVGSYLLLTINWWLWSYDGRADDCDQWGSWLKDKFALWRGLPVSSDIWLEVAEKHHWPRYLALFFLSQFTRRLILQMWGRQHGSSPPTCKLKPLSHSSRSSLHSVEDLASQWV